MTTAYFDCYSGISGDMTLGALVDLGVPVEELKRALAGLPVKGYQLSAQTVQRCGIGGTHVKVQLGDEAHEHGHEHKHGHEHELGQAHSHEHAHGHEHSHGHGHHHHHDHRGFSEICRIIEGSSLPSRVKVRAIDAFRRIAVEEAAVHGSTIEAVHFHEVGAVDAIVDIVGAMWCLDYLGISEVISSPIAVGSGTVRAAHGEMPVPAPATARLLAGIPVRTGPVSGELTTPTGAAIIRTVASRFEPLEDFVIAKIGYGAGTRTYPHHPNYLRVFLGKSGANGKSAIRLPVQHEQLAVISCEIDDMTGEALGFAIEKLFGLGALDVHAIPIHMKKGRPGVTLQALVRHETIERVLECLFRDTSTLGAKMLPCDRYSLERRIESVATTLGPIRVKFAMWNEETLKASPEYEDCRRIADEKNLPLADVFAAAMAAATKLKG